MKARVTGGVEATYWTGEDRMDIMVLVIVDQTESEGTRRLCMAERVQVIARSPGDGAKFPMGFLFSPTSFAH